MWALSVEIRKTLKKTLYFKKELNLKIIKFYYLLPWTYYYGYVLFVLEFGFWILHIILEVNFVKTKSSIDFKRKQKWKYGCIENSIEIQDLSKEKLILL